MFSRKHDELFGTELPTQWLTHISSACNEVFEEHILDKQTFDAHGEIFRDEILLIISLISDEKLTLPISLFLSIDIDDKHYKDMKLVKKSVDKMMDFAGTVFEEILATKDWDDYSVIWTAVNYQKNEIFYKVTRENVELSLEANRLLNDPSKNN